MMDPTPKIRPQRQHGEGSGVAASKPPVSAPATAAKTTSKQDPPRTSKPVSRPQDAELPSDYYFG